MANFGAGRGEEPVGGLTPDSGGAGQGARPWRNTAQAGRRTARIRDQITRQRDDVFLKRGSAISAARTQVLRALRGMVPDGELVCLGYGVCGRAETSQLSGQPMPAARGGFIDAAQQALDKLGVPWEPTEFQRAYNEGRSTQVPVNSAVRVKGRISGRLKYQDRELRFER
jgi:hypothetical protein